MPLDPQAIRGHFPALKRQAIFLDNPAGTQIVQKSLDRITDYLVNTNANHEGVFATSRESDAVIEEARQAAADFLNAPRPEEITFGPNMTSLTLNLSRSLARTLEAGDTIAVTRLDHDANITPWTLIAADRGCQVAWVDFDVEDGRLQMDSYEEALAQKPKLVALGYASNALGTINPVKEMTQMAHRPGPWSMLMRSSTRPTDRSMFRTWMWISWSVRLISSTDPISGSSTAATIYWTN